MHAGHTTTSADAGAAAAPQRDLARLIDGYLTTQLLYVAAKLGVAEVLVDGPRTGREVAEAVGADPDALTRMLRGLVLEDVLAEDRDGRFALTAVGDSLRDGVPGSQRGAILVRGEVYWSAAAGMLRTAIEGGTAFEHVHGERFFDHLAAYPEREATFQGSMADRARREAADVVAVYDFAGLRELVDVGGGSGVLLEAILRATPEPARRSRRPPRGGRRARAPGSQRPASTAAAECVVGDFFAAVPRRRGRLPALPCPARLGRRRRRAGARDLPRGDVRRRAPAARRGDRARARRATRPEAIRMDLHMLMLLRARERTEAQFRSLLAGAGFELRRVVPTGSPPA